jgi:anti-sigma factor (TIGR02949 family)
MTASSSPSTSRAADPAAECACTAARAFELLDGALEGAERAAFEAHLAACGPCRASVERDQRFLDALRGRDLTVPAPESLRRRIAAILRGLGRC